MRTLLIELNEEYGIFWVVCPLCQHLIKEDDIYNDDYVEDNSMLYCGEGCRAEILLCLATCENLNEVTDCSRPLSFEEALEEFPDLATYRKIIEDDQKTWYNPEGKEYPPLTYKQIGVLEVSDLVNDFPSDSRPDQHLHKGTPAQRTNFVNKFYHHLSAPEINFKRASCNTDHDGISLYYKAECTECKKVYQSHVWGD